MTKKQKFLSDMVLGILVYSVVLGFFNDYTDILQTGSYSITFAVSIVLQLLTFLTFMCKDRVVDWVKQAGNKPNKLAIGFSVWFIMFTSKFVFLAVIDIIFGSYVQISSFIGLFIIIATMSIVTSAISFMYKKSA